MNLVLLLIKVQNYQLFFNSAKKTLSNYRLPYLGLQHLDYFLKALTDLSAVN